MTAGEFRAWMDGFLIGKTTITRKDVETIRAKSQEVLNAWPDNEPVPWFIGWKPRAQPCASSASDRIPYVGAVQ